MRIYKEERLHLCRNVDFTSIRLREIFCPLYTYTQMCLQYIYIDLYVFQLCVEMKSMYSLENFEFQHFDGNCSNATESITYYYRLLTG